MTLVELLVTMSGVAAMGLVAWFFWGPRGEGVRAALTSEGRQEAVILVKGGYTPDIIIAEAGTPLRLTFLREESAACSETVLFPDFGRSVELPEGQAVEVDLLPEHPGEYGFACQMGMLRGTLVVR